MRGRLAGGALLLLLAACGGARPDAPPVQDSSAAGSPPPAFDACAVLAAVDLAGMVGRAPDSVRTTAQITAPDRALSQCVAWFPGPAAHTVGLVLTAIQGVPNPTSREAWIARDVTPAETAIGAEASAALRAAEVLPGLGDLAVLYQIQGPNLAVFWAGNRNLVAGAFGIPDAAGRRVVEALARQALARY